MLHGGCWCEHVSNNRTASFIKFLCSDSLALFLETSSHAIRPLCCTDDDIDLNKRQALRCKSQLICSYIIMKKYGSKMTFLKSFFLSH